MNTLIGTITNHHILFADQMFFVCKILTCKVNIKSPKNVVEKEVQHSPLKCGERYMFF